jgi:poly-gamma-glutamate capsule biosynthesis protein CapA/YwtB (metallophosphatase superfamily)
VRSAAGGRTWAGVTSVTLVALALAACSSGSKPAAAPATSSSHPSGAAAGKAKAPAGGSGAGSAAPVHLTLAFAGDVHFAGTSASALTKGLGSGAAPLAKADVAVVNLETAITDGGAQATKEFSFRAPASALKTLKAAGIDAANVANNHGMDYGATGLQDTLAASKTYGFPLIGAGQNVKQAFAGYRTTVRGVRVAVISATDVLDSSLQAAWTAGPDKPGLASAKDGDLMAQRITAVSQHADVVVAFLHWGVELNVCPTARQVSLAQELIDAGADVVVGSHAHVVQPLTRVGRVPVDYGMGNFVFYGTSPAATQSGVVRVAVTAVPGSGASGHPQATATWIPAHIVGGRPMAIPASSAPPLPSLAAC